jgi:hypothetical protein
MTLEGSEGQCHAPAALYPRKDPIPIVQEAGWTQDRSGQVRKISPLPGFDPQTIQPVASHYTDYASWPIDLKGYHIINSVTSLDFSLLLNGYIVNLCSK